LTDQTGQTRSLKVFGATVLDEAGSPGTLIKSNREDLIVGTGNGALRLDLIQLEGKLRMTADEFLRGTRPAAMV
jgi:methionyl-tRNA formyltransferase